MQSASCMQWFAAVCTICYSIPCENANLRGSEEDAFGSCVASQGLLLHTPVHRCTALSEIQIYWVYGRSQLDEWASLL
ncbi:hypothetical protein CPB84DRAFT_1800289, partial [Gymnopilus junonius]